MHELRITPKTAFVTTVIVAMTLLAFYGAFLLRDILLVLFGAIILAAAIQPLVRKLGEHGVNQKVAILATYLAFVVTVMGLLVFAIPPLIEFLSQVIEKDFLTKQLSSLLIDLRLTLWNWGQFRSLLPMVRMTPELAETIANTSEEVGKQAWPFMQQTAGLIGRVGLLFVIAFYWLVAREETLELFLKLAPSENRRELLNLWNEIESRLGAFLRAQGFLMFIVAVMSYVGLLVLQVPNAFALAIIAGLFEAVPLVGPIIGAIPAIAVALLVSPGTALLVALLYIAIQLVENNVLVPRVMSSNVGLNPLVVIIAIVAGAALDGVVGALFAIPIAGVIQGIAQHVWTSEASAVPAQELQMEPEDGKPAADYKEALVSPGSNMLA